MFVMFLITSIYNFCASTLVLYEPWHLFEYLMIFLFLEYMSQTLVLEMLHLNDSVLILKWY
jgi:hypothetical protein